MSGAVRARLAGAGACGAALQALVSLTLPLLLGGLAGAAPGVRSLAAALPLALLAPLLGLMRARHAAAPGPACAAPHTRFAMLLRLLTLHSCLLSGLYALGGYLAVSSYSALTDPRRADLLKPCERSEGRCLAEESFILQLGGFWIGTLYFLRTHVFGSTTLKFPPVHQEKLIQMKALVFGSILAGFKEAIMPTVYYVMFYWVWGNRPRSLVRDVYSLYLEDPPLDNILNLLTSGIWITLWFYSSLFLMSMYMINTIFEIILTEPMKFPIESSSLTLHQALSQRSQFIGVLAAHDLRSLAVSDPARRLQIFTLSQPGGHPHNWNNILHQCLQTITEFNKDLESIYNSPNQLDAPSVPDVVPIGYPCPPTMRNMASSPRLQLLKDHDRNKLEETFINAAKAEFQNNLNKLCQKPGISYFFGELTDSKLRCILKRGQPVMWSCEGLAFIAAASLYEDKYGIVQNDLPVIIEVLVEMKVNLEKLSKSGLLLKKHGLNDVFTMKIKSALMSSVKRSIYKIVHTFSKYMNDIPLSPELQVAVQPFRTFKEG